MTIRQTTSGTVGSATASASAKSGPNYKSVTNTGKTEISLSGTKTKIRKGETVVMHTSEISMNRPMIDHLPLDIEDT